MPAEQPDTAAIRAAARRIDPMPNGIIEQLCDALDAARNERDMHRLGESYNEEGEAFQKARAEAAEARIAAAMKFLDKPRGSGFPYARIAHAPRALTGETP